MCDTTTCSRLARTFKSCPAIAAATIGLCFLTQQIAHLFGIELPDQANIDIVRRSVGFNWNFAFLCLQILVLMPAVEEAIFRWLLFKLPLRRCGVSPQTGKAGRLSCVFATVSAALFSAAHYVFQPWPDAAFVALFFFGLAQCWLYRKTGRLWCAILNHGLFNLINLALLFLIPGGV